MKRSIGIYISKTNLQLVVLSKSLTKAKLIAADSIQVPPDAGIVPVIAGATKPAEAKAPLKKDKRLKISKRLTVFETTVLELLKKHNIKEAEVVATALPPELIIIRYFQMPRLAPAEHKTAVPFEARKYLPYKLQDIVYIYTVSYDKVASNKMAITFVAAEKASVYNYVKFFENIGLNAGYLEAIPYSLIRFLYYTKGIELNHTVALIHVGQHSANINLVTNKVIYLSRNVLFAGKSTQSGGAVVSSGLIDTAVLDSLLVETRLSFDYFHRQFPEDKIERMVIWADDKKTQEWGQKVGKDLNIDTKACNPFDSIEGADACPVEYATGCGLALRGLTEPYKDINLSPGFKKIEIEQLARLAIFEICLAIAALFMFYTIGAGKAGVLQDQLARVITERPNVKLETKDLSTASMEKAKSKIQERTGFLEGLVDKKIYMVLKLDKLSRLSPEGLWFNELSFTKPKGKTSPVMTLKGFVYRPKGENQIKVVNQFLDSLKSDADFSRGFAAIKLDSAAGEVYDGLPVTNFQISCSTE